MQFKGKAKPVLPSNKRRLGQVTAKSFLTQLVKRRAQNFGGEYKWAFNLWRRTQRTEILPNGVPFKVTSNSRFDNCGGTFVPGLNRPLILVSSRFTKAERLNIARHEFTEWKHNQESDRRHPLLTDAHKKAAKEENPKLRESAKDRARGILESSEDYIF